MTLAQKNILILVVTSILGSVGAAVGTGLMLRNKSTSATPEKQHKAPEKVEPIAPQTIHPLGEMVINLADAEPENLRYVKISIAVGLEEKLAEEALKEHDPALRDAIISVISQKSFATLHKPGALDVLKKELIEAMNGRIPKAHIAEMFIEGFAMQ